MSEKSGKLVGIVCSKPFRKVYCIKGSAEYNEKFQGLVDLDVIYIHFTYLSALIHKKTDVGEWNIDELLELEKTSRKS